MRLILSLFLMASPAFAFAEPPPIRLPDIAAPIVVPPSPAPPTPAPVDVIQRLTVGVWYVIDSDVPLLVLSSADGIVTASEYAGPMTMRGTFIDGVKPEVRTFKGKFIYSIEAAKSGRCELIVVPVGATKASDILRRTLDVQVGPPPKPLPPPDDGDVKPLPDPKPKPFTGKFRLVVIEETEAAANNRGAYFADKSLTEYLATRLSGKPRIADRDVVAPDGQPPKDLAPYLARAKKLRDDGTAKTLPQLFLVADDGTVLLEGDLPPTPAELLKIVQKVGR